MNPTPAQANVRTAKVVARGDGSPIVTGTVNFYLKALTGDNAGKWWVDATSTWSASEALAKAMTVSGTLGSWTVSIKAGAWIDGVEYLEEWAESDDLHVPVNRHILCGSVLAIPPGTWRGTVNAASGNTLQLIAPNGGFSGNDAWIGWMVTVGVQSRVVIDYVESTCTLYLDEPWLSNPTPGEVWTLTPLPSSVARLYLLDKTSSGSLAMQIDSIHENVVEGEVSAVLADGAHGGAAATLTMKQLVISNEDESSGQAVLIESDHGNAVEITAPGEGQVALALVGEAGDIGMVLGFYDGGVGGTVKPGELTAAAQAALHKGTHGRRVLYLSKAGNDANDGLTPDTAKQTLAGIAAKPLAAGDLVCFDAGAWVESIGDDETPITVALNFAGVRGFASSITHATAPATIYTTASLFLTDLVIGNTKADGAAIYQTTYQDYNYVLFIERCRITSSDTALGVAPYDLFIRDSVIIGREYAFSGGCGRHARIENSYFLTENWTVKK